MASLHTDGSSKLVEIADVTLPDHKPGVKVPITFKGKNHSKFKASLTFRPGCGCTSEVDPMEVGPGEEFTIKTEYDGSVLPIYYKKKIEVIVAYADPEQRIPPIFEFNIYFEGNIVK